MSEPPPLPAVLDDTGNVIDSGKALRSLVDQGWGDLPCPGSGRTLQRWRAFADVAARDLALAKLLESHADALAILQELGRHERYASGQLWGVWCAEPAYARLEVSGPEGGEATVRIHGTKAWCSGAACVTHALVSGWNEAGQPCLVAVDMAQPGIRVTREGWHAVGMAGAASVDVVFDEARAVPVGRPGAYVKRPGFHHGAAGVSACWYGAAVGIAGEVHRSLRARPGDPHALAHLGAIDIALAQAASQLRLAAVAIDAAPGSSCQQAVRRARLAAEDAAETVLSRAPRALGAGPVCKNARFARLLADLPVFIRQSHAERDLAAHGQAVAQLGVEDLWAL